MAKKKDMMDLDDALRVARGVRKLLGRLEGTEDLLNELKSLEERRDMAKAEFDRLGTDLHVLRPELEETRKNADQTKAEIKAEVAACRMGAEEEIKHCRAEVGEEKARLSAELAEFEGLCEERRNGLEYDSEYALDRHQENLQEWLDAEKFAQERAAEAEARLESLKVEISKIFND